MGLLDHLWDDVVAGPPPSKGLGKLRKSATFNSKAPTEGGDEGSERVTRSITVAKPCNRSLSFDKNTLPSSPTASSSPGSPSSSASSTPRVKDSVWRNVFHPGSNSATGYIGSEKFDKAEPNSRTVYDWLYSESTRSKWR
uniref:TSA: Wollemia nobilis Ref_Wollemi_Transcript_2612_849 transcribed RNA sequence n=1 Tax=Wollemia nobilis TaxID=56998 RepID=A0A0C9RQA0_9CONI